MNAADWSFDRDGVISLRGEWEFYDHVLLGPQDFQANQAEWMNKRHLVQVPSGWKKTAGISDGKGYGAGTFRLRVNVNQPGLYSLRAKKVRLSSRGY